MLFYENILQKMLKMKNMLRMNNTHGWKMFMRKVRFFYETVAGIVMLAFQHFYLLLCATVWMKKPIVITGFQWRATKLKIVAGEPRLRVADFQEIQVAIVPHIAIAAQTPHSATAELVILVKSATIVAMVLTEPVGLVGKDTQRRRTPIAVVQVKFVLYLL